MPWSSAMQRNTRAPARGSLPLTERGPRGRPTHRRFQTWCSPEGPAAPLEESHRATGSGEAPLSHGCDHEQCCDDEPGGRQTDRARKDLTVVSTPTPHRSLTSEQADNLQEREVPDHSDPTASPDATLRHRVRVIDLHIRQ